MRRLHRISGMLTPIPFPEQESTHSAHTTDFQQCSWLHLAVVEQCHYHTCYSSIPKLLDLKNSQVREFANSLM